MNIDKVMLDVLDVHEAADTLRYLSCQEDCTVQIGMDDQGEACPHLVFNSFSAMNLFIEDLAENGCFEVAARDTHRGLVFKGLICGRFLLAEGNPLGDFHFSSDKAIEVRDIRTPGLQLVKSTHRKSVLAKIYQGKELEQARKARRIGYRLIQKELMKF